MNSACELTEQFAEEFYNRMYDLVEEDMASRGLSDYYYETDRHSKYFVIDVNYYGEYECDYPGKCTEYYVYDYDENGNTVYIANGKVDLYDLLEEFTEKARKALAA